MGRGKLLFKGDDKKKKKKKSKHSFKVDETVAAIASTSAQGTLTSAGHEAARTCPLNISKPASPKVLAGTGTITTGSTVVNGIDTKFEREVAAGDALIVCFGKRQEMRVVTMRLSNVSLNISSAFSENVKTPSSFQIIRKPRDEAKQKRLAERDREWTKKQEEERASGTFGSTEELIYRERTEHGNYRIKRAKVEGGVSRESLLDMRSKKTSDKYC